MTRGGRGLITRRPPLDDNLSRNRAGQRRQPAGYHICRPQNGVVAGREVGRGGFIEQDSEVEKSEGVSLCSYLQGGIWGWGVGGGGEGKRLGASGMFLPSAENREP